MHTQPHSRNPTRRRRRRQHPYDMGWNSDGTYTIRYLGPPIPRSSPLSGLTSDQRKALLLALMQTPVGPGDTGDHT